LAEIEIVARVERRRKWSESEKAALLAEVEAEGGKVAVVARRHGVAESLLYGWRSARKAAVAAREKWERLTFIPVRVVGAAADGVPALLSLPRAAGADRQAQGKPDGRLGVIDVELPSGVRLRVDALVDEKALRRVLHALKGVA